MKLTEHESTEIKELMQIPIVDLVLSHMSHPHKAKRTFKDLAKHSIEDARHSVRVARLGQVAAVTLNLGPKAERHLMRAGLLHDVGKLDVPPQILLKPGSLTGDEREIIQTHVRKGVERIKKINPRTARIAAWHHEFGQIPYPRVVQEPSYSGPERRETDEQILRLGRLLSIADKTDAKLSERVDQPAQSVETATEELIFLYGQEHAKLIRTMVRVRKKMKITA